MKTNRLFSWKLLLVTLILASVCPPAVGQDGEEAEEEGFGELYAEIEAWVAQPAGLDYFPATELDLDDPFQTRLLMFPTGTEAEYRYRAGFELSGNRGGLILTWYAHQKMVDMTRSSPGNYIFGELLAHPYLAGYYNDGLGDGFTSGATTTLRDLRIDYYRTAFKNARAEAKWFVGWRRVSNQRLIEGRYFALIHDLPPLTVINRPSLLPGADTATIESDYEGRGVNAGMDFLMPLWKRKIALEGGFALTALRGKTDATYRSTTYAYLLHSGPDSYVLSPPYDDAFENSLPSITQEEFEIGLIANNVPSSGSVLEGYVGVRWMAWRGLEVFGGFRSTRYDDLGVDLRPKTSSLYAGTNLQDLTENDRSATYEGFYGGLAYRF